MKGKIVVVGSSNTDMVIRTDYFPKPGETIIGGKFLMNPGGKGANQAIAAARMGAKVTFIAKLGNDIFSVQAMHQLEKEGINIDYIVFDKVNPSGVALITVDAKGENTIVVAPGSNMELSPLDFADGEQSLTDADIWLMQLEIPMSTVAFCAHWAKSKGKKVILNPAPASPLNDDLLLNLYLITPNETETELITGIRIDDEICMKRACEWFKNKGVENVIITLGAKGVYLSAQGFSQIVAAPLVKAIDTTAAGDVFNGALVAALSENLDWIKATEFAVKAASISVTRIGAQSSAPYRSEI
ncbi:MAG TPA: ribokinase [Cytophagaceae bacterium]